MKITARGRLKIGGGEMIVVWEDGRLTGDAVAAAEIEDFAEQNDNRPLGDPSTFGTVTGHLRKPWGFYLICQEIFETLVIEGYEPVKWKIPPGARP